VFFLFLSFIRVPSIYGDIVRQIKEHEEELSKQYNFEYRESRVKFDAVKFIIDFVNPAKSKIFDALKKKQLSVIYCRKSQNRFIIGDSPVFFHNDKGPNGLAFKETEIYFPISPTSCVVLQDNIPNMTYLHIDQLDFIDQINKMTYEMSLKYVFSDEINVLEKLI
jgi:hypothetical protein